MKRLGVEHLYLFGSTARGEAREDSDVDLFFDHPQGSLGLFEQGIEIIAEASRHLPEDLKARHPKFPLPKAAGIGNVLRHEYERIAHDVLWRVVHDDLPPLEKACREEWARGQAAEGVKSPKHDPCRNSAGSA